MRYTSTGQARLMTPEGDTSGALQLLRNAKSTHARHCCCALAKHLAPYALKHIWRQLASVVFILTFASTPQGAYSAAYVRRCSCKI